MKFACYLVIIALAAFLLPALSIAETLTADFEGGGSLATPVTDEVDAFTGMAGNGWADGWISSSGSSAAVLYHNVLEEGDGTTYSELVEDNYLHYRARLGNTSSGRHSAVSRDYSAGVDPALDHTIQFTFRIDEDLTAQNFSDKDDRIEIFDSDLDFVGDNAFINSGWCTWGIGVRGDHGEVWEIKALNGVATPITAVTGVAYTFTLDFHTATGTFDVAISGDDDSSYTGTGFELYRTTASKPSNPYDGHETSGYLTFSGSGKINSGDSNNYREFSVDGIKISQVPEPATITLLLGMILAAAILRRRG